MPFVSVVIPAYQRASTILRSVSSVLAQTHHDLEVIVVDDGSTDGMPDLVEARRDPRIRLVRHDRNQGGSAARNTGIREARGDLIAFQDSDDEWLPRKLERQLERLAVSPEGTVGVFCGMIVVGRPDDTTDFMSVRYVPRGLASTTEIVDRRMMLEHGSLISTQTFVGRRDALLAIDGFDTSLKALQDWDCFLRLSRLGGIAFEPEPLVIQYFSGNSLTRSNRNRVTSLAAILAKNDADLRALPSALAKHSLTLAGGYRRHRDHEPAVHALVQAARTHPVSPRIWFSLVYSLVCWAAAWPRRFASERK